MGEKLVFLGLKIGVQIHEGRDQTSVLLSVTEPVIQGLYFFKNCICVCSCRILCFSSRILGVKESGNFLPQTRSSYDRL